MNTIRYSAQQLIAFATNTYRALGVADQDAELLAQTLCQADLWNHQSHGIMRTFWYATRIQSGATRIDLPPIRVVDAGAIAVIDGQNGIGQVVAEDAMREAITRSKQHGIGAVAVRNSGHFGTAMYYTRQAANAGCIGFLSSNASPAMAPWGGREKLIGNNPWSIAAPAGQHPPMMLDIANTAVARGKLYLARQRSESIPDGWAIDAQGRPTNDAAAGIAGTILPLAGHKGYAIATVMDMLSGVLSGSGFGNDIVGPYMPDGESGVGHLAMAINIAAFRPLPEFIADMEEMIRRIKDTPRQPGIEEIFYPGEPEARADQLNRAQGVVLPEKTVEELSRSAAALGISALPT